MNSDGYFNFEKNKEFEEKSIFPPLCAFSKVVDENGEPLLKLHSPEWKNFPREQQDLLLALEIVGEDLLRIEGLEPVKPESCELVPQLSFIIDGKNVSIVVRVSRIPKKTSYIDDIEEVKKIGGKGVLYFANVELIPCGIRDGNESFFVNYRGIQKLIC